MLFLHWQRFCALDRSTVLVDCPLTNERKSTFRRKDCLNYIFMLGIIFFGCFPHFLCNFYSIYFLHLTKIIPFLLWYNSCQMASVKSNFCNYTTNFAGFSFKLGCTRRKFNGMKLGRKLCKNCSCYVNEFQITLLCTLHALWPCYNDPLII